MPSKPIGLYANIAAKRERIAKNSGEKMRSQGSAGAPTVKAFKQSAKTAKMADGGSMSDDYDDSDAPPRTKYRPAPDARSYDSDIDYRDGSSGKTRAPLPPSIKPNKADAARKGKIAKKNDLDTKIMSAAQKSGNKDIAEKAFVRRQVRSRSEGLQSGAKMFPNSAPKMRKQWSEEIGGGKPAPFKTGGKAKSCW